MVDDDGDDDDDDEDEDNGDDDDEDGDNYWIYLAKSSELGGGNPKDDAGVEDKEMCRTKVLQ